MIELRSGAKVRYSPAHQDVVREGKLVRPSATGEEWLVRNEFGDFWIAVNRLRPPEDAPQPE